MSTTTAKTIPSAVRLTPTATIEVERLVSTTELADAMGVSRQSVINAVMYCTVPEPDFIIGKAWGWKGSRLPNAPTGSVDARLFEKAPRGGELMRDTPRSRQRARRIRC